MYKTYTSNELATLLDSIALGNTYSVDALLAAKLHTVTTTNDYAMISRWLFGNWTANCAHQLQQLAIYIRESKQGVNLQIK